MSYMQRYMTGKKVPINLSLHMQNGETRTISTEGSECRVGMGDLFVRLCELMELKRKRSSWWYVFFNGRYATLEIDAEIRELTRALNQAHVEWATYGH